MSRYLKLLGQITRYNLIREMEFRENFFLWLTIQGIWLGIQLFIVQTFFIFTDNLLGWTKFQVFLIVGLFRVIRGIFDFFIYANLMELPESISQGALDYSLTKPINSLFYLSFRRQQYSQAGTMLTGIGITAYAIYNLGLTNPINFIQIIFGVCFGLVAFYSIILSFATLSFFLTRLSAMSSFYDTIQTALRYPMELFTGKNVITETILFPFALVATIPAKVLIAGNWTNLTLEAIGSLVLFCFAFSFWNFAIKRYSSASS